MLKIFILILAVWILSINSASLEEKIIQYFKSDVFKNLQKHWKAHRRSFEHAIELALKESYGYKGMNVYVRRAVDTLRITNGFYLSDNVIELVLLGTSITSIPHITMPKVTFALASSILKIDAGLSNMILDTRYLLFRNQSDILYSKAEQDPLKNSPFSFQQVQSIGHLTIVVDGCSLAGYALVKLSGHSVTLGHDTFHIKGCKFGIEISPYHLSGPPVIAPYFSQEQRKQLEVLLTRPIREEMLPKLQAALFSYINTSVIFGDYLPKFREYQDDTHKHSAQFLNAIVQSINNQTVELNEVTVNLNPLSVSWKAACRDKSHCWNEISVSNVTLHGLDTLYSSHTGGSFLLEQTFVTDSFKFNSMMVHGNIFLKNNTVERNHEFVAEIRDLAVNIEMDLNKTTPVIDVATWRQLELSILELENNDLKDCQEAHSFVHGYLIHTVPDTVRHHVYKLYVKAIKQMRTGNGKVKKEDDCECRH